MSPSLRHRGLADHPDHPDEVGAVGHTPHDGPEAAARRDEIGWFRGIATGVVILVVGLGVSVGAANEILTNLSGLSRDNLQYLASTVFVALLVVAAWVLRRLQARGVI